MTYTPTFGDAIFTSDWGVLGAIVRLNSGKDLFHPALVGHVGIIRDTNTVVEANGLFVTNCTFMGFCNRKSNIYVAKLNDKSKALLETNKVEVNKFLDYTIGKPYDLTSVIEVFLYRNLKILKPKETKGEYFCSELVANSYGIANIISNTTNYADISPQDVYDLKIYDSIIRIK
jgi:hypothetical protein